MFKVEENLLLTKNQLSQDSYVLEDCSAFFPELAGFYVCAPRENSEAIKNYMRQQPNSGFVVKTYEDDMVNGLKLLLRMEQLNSYTEEFVKYYGGTSIIIDTFSSLNAESVTQVNDNTDVTPISAETSFDNLDDYIDDSMFQSLAETLEDDTEDAVDDSNSAAISNTTEDVINNVEPDYSVRQDTIIPDIPSDAQTEELYLMIRGIACKLGVIDYDDSHTLSKADMKNAQLAIKTLSAMTVQEGMLGALALAETKEDLGAVTRFLELFYTYLRENGLNR